MSTLAWVHDLVSLYSGWVDIHQPPAASPERGLYWHDRWLRNLNARLKSTHFGTSPDAHTLYGHNTARHAAAAPTSTLKPVDARDVFDHIGLNHAWVNPSAST